MVYYKAKQALAKRHWLVCNKAEEYLQSSNDVAQALGNDPKSKMVTSRSGGTLHFVRVVSPGQYVCDKNCLQWCSS